MDSIEQQIHGFRYEATEGAKPRMVEELSWTEDERIVPFLLEVLADVDEPDLARVEAARALATDVDSLRDDICDVLLTVIARKDEDEIVYQQALLTAMMYLDDSSELAAAVADRQGYRRMAA